VVFAAFNQSYKIDRLSFSVWMQILQEVPRSVLWLLGQSDKAQSQLLQEAQAAGVSPQRLIFAPFVEPDQHLARLALADAMLDTLICNGHTTTSDALWMGVPVLTRQGAHFASRVSESLLQAVNMPELIGQDSDDMIRIAKKIGLDSQWRQHIREQLADNMAQAPLFDTLRFTRDFEKAIALMVERCHAGLAPDHLDVSAQPLAPSTHSHTHCPLCESTQMQAIGEVRLNSGARTWMRCSACSHLFVKDYWNELGLELMDQAVEPTTFLKDIVLEHDARRAHWAHHIERVITLTGGFDAPRIARTRWLDVGCADASLVLSARDYGFDAVGVELMRHKTDALSSLSVAGIDAGDWLQNDTYTDIDIVSLHNVLECLAFPLQALKHAHQTLRPSGLLIISLPDAGCSSWHLLEKTGSNPYWVEPEIQHQLNRVSLMAWLDKTGFDVVDISVASRFKAQIEVYARKR
jgi:SAM-dependent methyltransferase